jgi:hypothetical protein
LPKSSRSEIRGVARDCLKIAIKAPPEKGKANQELIKFLSKKLRIPKSEINIISGLKSRRKEILLKANEDILKLINAGN